MLKFRGPKRVQKQLKVESSNILNASLICMHCAGTGHKLGFRAAIVIDYRTATKVHLFEEAATLSSEGHMPSTTVSICLVVTRPYASVTALTT